MTEDRDLQLVAHPDSIRLRVGSVGSHCRPGVLFEAQLHTGRGLIETRKDSTGDDEANAGPLSIGGPGFDDGLLEEPSIERVARLKLAGRSWKLDGHVRGCG